MRSVTRTAALGHRLAVNGLTGSKLPRSRLTAAARPGLQDGSPRSGLLSLAVRVDAVQPHDWRNPQLKQVFGPRGAIYLVPQEDVGIFSLGLLPRDPGRIEHLRDLEQTVHRILDDGPVRQTDLVAALPEIEDSRELRWASTLGTILPVWDTVDTIVHPAPPPEIDPEEARRELARRFFRHIGPAAVADLQWWLDGSRADANVTAEAIASELEELFVDGRRCLVTAPFAGADPDPDAVLLLPPDDPYINRRTRDTLLPEPTTRRLLWPQAPPPGALVIGGEIAGTWRRRATTVEFSPWCQVEPEHRIAAEEIAAAWPLGETPGAIKWNPPA